MDPWEGGIRASQLLSMQPEGETGHQVARRNIGGSYTKTPAHQCHSQKTPKQYQRPQPKRQPPTHKEHSWLQLIKPGIPCVWFSLQRCSASLQNRSADVHVRVSWKREDLWPSLGLLGMKQSGLGLVTTTEAKRTAGRGWVSFYSETQCLWAP